MVIDNLEPKEIFKPSSIDELISIVKRAYEEDKAISPICYCTKLKLGNPLKRLDYVISMEKIRDLVEYGSSDLYITAKAGMKLKDLQNILKSKNQYLPLDPPYYDKASLGGLVSTNSFGPKRLKYGSLRDLVLGLKIVTSDGKLIRAGGKVVKNVAGYDLVKLYIGSLGTLGIITEVTFRVYPLPEKEATVKVKVRDYREALKLKEKLQDSYLLPSSLDLINPYLSSSINLTQDYYILVRFDGLKVDVDREIKESLDLFRREGFNEVEILEKDEDLWKSIINYSKEIVLKFGILPTDLPLLIKLIEEYNLKPSLHYHLALGLGRIFLDYKEYSLLGKIIDAIREEIYPRKGYLVIESSPLELKRYTDAWGKVRKDFPLMKKIKEALDPKGILNPGKFVGGI